MLRRVEPGQPLGLGRGDIVVCIPVFGAPELFSQCLSSVLEHTPEDVPLLIADDASTDPGVATVIDALGKRKGLRRKVFHYRQPSNRGFPGNCNDAFRSAAPADVVILNSDCRVAAQWFPRLRAAAYSDSIVASATPLTNNGTIVSVPDRNRPRPDLPTGWDLDTAAAAIAAGSLQLYPRIPTAVGHCTYIKRSALELVGDFDEAFSPGYGEEVDWSQRCVLRGLGHVVADDVLVFHHGSASFGAGAEARRLQARHDALNRRQYPYYARWVQAEAESTTSQLARSLAAGRRVLEGLSVTVDGSSLGPVMTGTQVLVLETILALQRQGGIRLSVAVPHNLGAIAREELARAEIETYRTDARGRPRADIVHRPAQVGRRSELLSLKAMGDRTVVSQLDFIAYRNPGYFDGFDEWHRYRATTREALARADRVLFISEHSRAEGIAESLVEPGRAHVVYPGVDHWLMSAGAGEPVRPATLAAGTEEFLLVFGVDFRHKNRLFALELFDRMRRAHGWRGRLLLVGPAASPGSSGPEEDLWLAAHPETAESVVRIGHVDEREKRWLLQHARLVVAPSVYEGFGLVPFEAAALGTPTLVAPQASLAEVLPPDATLLVAWDAESAAELAMELLEDRDRAEALVATVSRAGAAYTWRAAAERLAAIYLEAVNLPSIDGWLVNRGESSDGDGDVALLVPNKALRYWTQFGVLNGTRLGLQALGNRVRRRLAARRRPPDAAG